VVLIPISSSSTIASTSKADHSAIVLSLWSLFLITFTASSTGTIVKRLTTSKLTRISRLRRFTDFNNYMKWPEFLMNDSDFPAILYL
jgi:hypothetical protein